MMKTIPLTRGKVAVVDDEDYEDISSFRWNCNRYGYAQRNMPRAQREIAWVEMMHRRIMKVPAKSKMEVDHINGDPLDNRKCNLRVCTHAENQRNRRIQANNKSGYKGVRKVSNSNTWRAQIFVENKEVHLGCFATPELANLAYMEAAKKYYGEFANSGERK